jgi:hypothetical protein
MESINLSFNQDLYPTEALRKRAESIELMRRAVHLDDASRALKLPYTFRMHDISKRERMQKNATVGMVYATHLDAMVDDLIVDAIRRWPDVTRITQNSTKHEEPTTIQAPALSNNIP